MPYAKEEISNRFVFKLNRAPEKELTLEDFQIDCPSDSSLTIKGIVVINATIPFV